MSREHALIEELRAARRTLAATRTAEQDARAAVHERKADRIRAEAAVEEIVSELETGRSSRPLLDAVHGQAARAATPEPEEESADERQRGPTGGNIGPMRPIGPMEPPAISDGHQATKRPPRKRKTESADRREAVISPNGPVRQIEAPELPTANQRIAARLIGPRVPGPMNQDAALDAALKLIPSAVLRLQAGTATDDEIHRELIQWPSQRKTYDHGCGNAWAVIGGSQPKFYYDTDALDKFGTLKAVNGADSRRRRPGEGRPPRPACKETAAVRGRRQARPIPQAGSSRGGDAVTQHERHLEAPGGRDRAAAAGTP